MKFHFTVKGLIFILVQLATIQLDAQYKGIEVPVIKEVNTFEEVNAIIPIYLGIDSSNHNTFLRVNNELIENIDSLPNFLLKEFNHLCHKGVLNTTRIKLELIVDQDITMDDFDQLRNKLIQYDRTAVILSAKSEFYSKIENIWTTGIYHGFNKFDQNLWNKLKKKGLVKDASKYNLNYIFSEKVRKSENRFDNDLKIIPPPPPRQEEITPELIPNSYSDSLESKFPHCHFVEIDIFDYSDYMMNQEELKNYHELIEAISKINIGSETVFLVKVNPKSKYSDYVKVISSINQEIYKRRQKMALALYDVEFSKLEKELFLEIISKIPYYIIEKPVIYDLNKSEKSNH